MKIAKKLIFAALFIASANVNADWSIVAIDTPFGDFSEGIAINNSGMIIGDYGVNGLITGSFFTGPDGVGRTKLGDFGGTAQFTSAWSINDAGEIVGNASTVNEYHPYVTGPGGIGMTDLSVVNPILSNAEARDINNSSQIVGTYFPFSLSNPHVFITGPNGIGLTDVGTLGGSYSFGSKINNSGQVVGFSATTGDTSFHAFITNPGGTGITDIGTLGGNNSISGDINDSGHVVGWSETTNGGRHAFITGANGSGMTDLGTMGGDESFSFAVNNNDQVIGIANYYGDAGSSSFLYSDGKMINLSTLDEVVNNGWKMLIVRGINDNGQIVGYGIKNNTEHAFLLTITNDNSFFTNYVEKPINHLGYYDVYAIPEPSIYAMLLAGLGLLGFMARRRKESASFIRLI
jgi:probable HAF family extracellular repeat protein